MLFTIKKGALSVFIWLALVLLSTTSVVASENIIYEYDIITQQKGQSLKDALKGTRLSTYQTKLMLKLPVMREAKSTRQFRVIYEKKDGKRLMREVKVTRGNRMGNFVLTGRVGNHKFISKASQIPEKKLKKIPKQATKTANSDVKFLSIQESLFAMKVAQSKGEKFNDALSPLKLSKTQLSLINSGKFAKSAQSNREITLYFAGNRQNKLLRGFTIKRDKRRVDFSVSKKDGRLSLINLRVVDAKTWNKTLANFAKAPIVSDFSSKKTATTSKSSSKIVQRNGKVTESPSYRLYRIRQDKGQTLNSSMKKFSLSNAQRELIKNIPVTSRAKSTRFFYTLFEKKGNRQYLKAVRVSRGKNVAEFVLVKYKNKWIWVNKHGKISSGKGGFLRYPLSFRRVSSGFNLRRRHPITRRIRPHKGTDFSARHGTSVWAPADGVVTFAGRQRGFGITLVIDHGKGYKTKYAHLSRIMKGARKGRRVKQRQVIARVGNTGFSTGSHLHYEVHVNGRPRNPMRVRLPGGGKSFKTLSSAKKATKKYLPQIRRML